MYDTIGNSEMVQRGSAYERRVVSNSSRGQRNGKTHIFTQTAKRNI